MTTYKFLASGAVGPLSGFAWPVPSSGAPGAWVESVGPLALCARGVHVCRASDLAHWINDELWEVETDGEQLEGFDCVVVQRGRLVRRIDKWSGAGGERFAKACVEHAAAQARPADAISGLLEDGSFISANGYIALAAYTTALAVSRLRSDVEAAEEEAYRRERAWQSAWLAHELL